MLALSFAADAKTSKNKQRKKLAKAEQLNIEEEAEERDTEVPHAAHARTRIVRTARNFPAPMLYLENIAPRWQEHARGDGAMYFLENKLQLLDVRFSHLQQPSTSQN